MKSLFKKYMPRIYTHLVSLRDAVRGHSKNIYSQFGEDAVLSTLLDKKKGFYVDVGAYQPKRFSNTYLFYKQGWSGINIDAKPGSMSLFQRQRQRDINLEIGISENGENAKFYVFEESAYNTFSDTLAQSHVESGIALQHIADVKTERLETILDMYVPSNTVIDFLTIDVESLDLSVLKSNNWDKYKPTYILVETDKKTIEEIVRSDLYTFLSIKGYKLVSFVYITLIFKYEPNL